MLVSWPQAWNKRGKSVAKARHKRGSGSGSGVSQLGHSPFTAATVMAATAALGAGDSKGMGRKGHRTLRVSRLHRPWHAGCHRIR